MNTVNHFEMTREFPLTEDNFLYLSRLATEKTGIVFGDGKVEMVYTRLCRRLRQLGLASFDEYIRLLKQDSSGEEISVLVNSLTTNLTTFYRSKEHFSHLKDTILPEAAERVSNQKNDRIRIWSAGCSTGEEPFSIAMTAINCLGSQLKYLDLKILATDIDTRMLNHAAAGAYSERAVKDVGAADRLKFFEKVGSGDENKWRISELTRALITFKRLNLLEKWPMRGPFDAVLCRNVMIYFDHYAKQKLLERFSSILRPGGCLYLGSSESVTVSVPGLERAGSTIYRRVN